MDALNFQTWNFQRLRVRFRHRLSRHRRFRHSPHLLYRHRVPYRHWLLRRHWLLHRHRLPLARPPVKVWSPTKVLCVRHLLLRRELHLARPPCEGEVAEESPLREAHSTSTSARLTDAASMPEEPKYENHRISDKDELPDLHPSSDESEPDLTDSSSEDELGVPGERVQRFVGGRLICRRVKRPRNTMDSRSTRPSSTPAESSSEDDATCRAGPGGDPLTGSSTGVPNAKPLRKIRHPSNIEEAAMSVM